MLQLYIDLALSRLARHAIQPIQLYSYTAIHAIQHTALYSVPQALSPHVGAWHRAGPAECYCSPSRSCARCVTSSASGRTYAAHSVDCSTDAAAVQPTASRWCDNLEREPEREPECGPSHVPLPQPDSWSRTRSWRCRRWRLPKRRSPRRIRKSSGRRGGRAGAEAEEGDEPGCEGVEALGVRWPRANPRVAVCFR